MAVTTASFLADVLRAAGLHVVEHDGWKTRGEGAFKDLTAVVWHHDASAPGYSPGMADYILHQVDLHKPGANCWVTLDGTWHLIAAEVTYHAGRVLAGKPDNHHSLGIETDHTTGETWSGVDLLDSLRRGTAAILRHLERPVSTGLEFHKTICAPVGRKTDPDGLDLAVERAAVAALRLTPPKEDVYVPIERIIVVPEPKNGRQLVSKDRDGRPLGKWPGRADVCGSALGDLTRLMVQPTRFGDDLVLVVAKLDGTPAPAGAEARVLIESS